MSAAEHRTPAEFWEDRYGGPTPIWTGNVNRLLADAVAGLAPGTALDLGCGEGGDALWLAREGWTVTAVDIATAALATGAERAVTAGVAHRITWERHDLSASFPAGTFDLVAASYLHSPVELPRAAVLRRAAGAVAPGGALVVVGHAGSPSWSAHRPDVHFPTPDEVLADLALPDGGWTILQAAVVDVAMDDPDGNPASRPDNVLVLRRT